MILQLRECPLAYTATKTVENANVNGRAYTVWTIVETDVGVTDEWEIDVPTVGIITLFECVLATATSTGTTVQPEIGSVSAWTDDTLDEVDVQDTAAARINDQTFSAFVAPAGKLYGRSTPDAGTDNDITTRITIMAGHER